MSEKQRSEQDLRAAFTLAAQDAPETADVLARLAAAQAPPPVAAPRSAVRRWAPIAAAAAIVIAIAVPVGFAVSNSSSGNRSSASSVSVGDAKAAPAAAGSSAAAASSAAAGDPGSSGSSVAAGIINPSPEIATPSPGPSAGRTCAPGDVALTLTWTQTDHGLTGSLKATNTTSAACDLAVKPAVYPLDSGGRRLPVLNAVSAEGYAGPSRLLAGASATSALSWSSWCGAKASNRAEVDWNTGTATVSVTGPTTPACVSGGASNISSNWFTPLS
jgi:Protein of unknown function (DUF4232)